MNPLAQLQGFTPAVGHNSIGADNPDRLDERIHTSNLNGKLNKR